MIPTTAIFNELRDEPAWCPRIVDFGTVYVDTHDDQPPYIGLMLELSYPELRSRFRQMQKLPIPLLDELIRQLTIHRDHLAGT